MRTIEEKEKELDMVFRNRHIEVARYRCFCEAPSLYNSTFETDKYKQSPLSIIARRYVDEWNENRKNGTGLFIYGDTGVGKTFYSACITNELIKKAMPLRGEFKALYNFLPSLEFISKQEQSNFLNTLGKVDFAFLDEFDASSIPRNAVNFYFTLFNIIYERKIPFVLTTNASPESVDNDKQRNVTFAKIYDRIAQQCAKYGFQTNTFQIRSDLTKRAREADKRRQVNLSSE